VVVGAGALAIVALFAGALRALPERLRPAVLRTESVKDQGAEEESASSPRTR
jgi:hypothetical protein